VSEDAFGRREGAEDTRPDPVEEAGETTAAESIPSPADTRPIGEGTTADVEGEGKNV
jgi:hypothetical protein